MQEAIIILLIQVLPLLGFLILALVKKRWMRKSAGIVATVLISGSFLLAVYMAWQYFFVTGAIDGHYPQLLLWRFHWLALGNGLSIDMGFLLTPLSTMMAVVVSFISFLVHLYSISYMKDEKRITTYFSFLSLFTFSMLALVLSSNMLQLYMFWELVGVSSFLLISFYYDRSSAAAAAKKAFIITRFADLGLLIGILMLSFYSHTLDINTLIERLTDNQHEAYKEAAANTFLGISALSWAMLLVFIGAAGKSALFPLHIWLPDAMEGPTPVSALIHAATMVVAGVFLVARLFAVYVSSTPSVLALIGYTGIVTAVMAAIIACTQTDIKRILAYSTMSQIGYMIFALGMTSTINSSGYSAALFHLFTHAIFKALLFLGAGVIIHKVHSNELSAMGGLRKKLPVTHICFLVACLAIAGIPPFSGFFSKEMILLSAWQENKVLYFIAVLTSGLTAFYMFRLYFSVFWNKPAELPESRGKETAIVILLPLVLLAILSLITGFIPFSHYVAAGAAVIMIPMHLDAALVPILLAITGIGLARFLYGRKNNRPEKVAAVSGSLYTIAVRSFYINELYSFFTRKFIFKGIATPAAWFDVHIVNGLVNATAASTLKISLAIKKMQSGRLQQYTVYFLISVIGLALLLVYFWN